MSPDTAIPANSPSLAQSETFKLLCDLARKKAEPLPPEILAAHVLAVTVGAEWPVQRAAMDAILRRLAIAQEEKLKVASRPPQVAGAYTTRQGREARPYRTWLLDVLPLRGSCDCPDFIRNSLGLCKHVLAALLDFQQRQNRRKSPLPVQLPAGWPAATLLWDPIRPLTGTGDWLLRVTTTLPVPSAVRKWFIEETNLLRTAFPDDPRQRLALVRGLLQVVRHPPKDLAIDPPLKPLLQREEARLQRQLHGLELSTRAPEVLKALKHRLYPYQRKGVLRALTQGRLLLADDMGLGKTAQAIAACHVLWRLKKVRRGLLIVPASLKSQWEREWSSFCDVPLSIVEGSPAERQAFYERTKRGFLIANYEQAVRDLAIMQAWAPDIVVLDEAQRIKNWETKTAVAVKALQPEYRLVLTGTPMENRLDELASLMDWVDDLALEPKWRLVPFHVKQADGTRENIGAQHLDTLRARLDVSMLRRRRSEVLKELPSRTDTRRPVELTPAQQLEHDELNLPIARLVHTSHKRALRPEEFLRLMSLLTRQRIICNGLALTHFEEIFPSLQKQAPNDTVLANLAAPKLKELRELVANLVIAQEQKVVIFSQWRRMLSLASWAVSDLLQQARVRGVFFSGEESLKRRAQNIAALHDDPQTRVLFATDAGGVGLNLQRAATCCINLELPWNPAVLEQRIGRIYRNGQKHPVEIYNLVSNEGIESRIADLVSDKRALFGGLFDGTTDEVKFEGAGSFLSRVEKLVELQALPPDMQTAELDGSPDHAQAVEDASEAEQPAVSDQPVGGVTTPTDQPQATAPPTREPVAVSPAPHAAPASPREIRHLFEHVRVQSTPDGGISISAPKEAAASLATLFGEFARKLAEAAESDER